MESIWGPLAIRQLAIDLAAVKIAVERCVPAGIMTSGKRRPAFVGRLLVEQMKRQWQEPLPFRSDQLARLACCMRKMIETKTVSIDCLGIQPAEGTGKFSIVCDLVNSMYFKFQASAVQRRCLLAPCASDCRGEPGRILRERGDIGEPFANPIDMCLREAVAGGGMKHHP